MIFRKLRTWYTLHKWTSIFTGLALIMWLITGMVMSWEKLFPELTPVESVPPDFRVATMPPADAMARLEEILGQSPQVSWLDLRQILNTVVYEVKLKDGSIHLLNAQSGQEFNVTPELAEEIARAEFPTQASILRVERLNGNDFSYPFGPVPVYRVVFDDSRATHAHVSIRTDEIWGRKTGAVWRNDRWGRARTAINTLHTFDMLRIITDRRRLITTLLWAAAIVTFLAAVLGYYLALPRRWRVF